MWRGKVAAGFVIFRQVCGLVEFLMMQTSYGIHHWTPPKGHVDPGETEIETAYRETLEEAGFKKAHLKVYPDSKQSLNYLVEGKNKTVVYWLAELIEPTTEVKMSKEHQDFKWLKLEEACEICGYDDMKGLLKSYEQYIKTKIFK